MTPACHGHADRTRSLAQRRRRHPCWLHHPQRRAHRQAAEGRAALCLRPRVRAPGARSQRGEGRLPGDRRRQGGRLARRARRRRDLRFLEDLSGRQRASAGTGALPAHAAVLCRRHDGGWRLRAQPGSALVTRAWCR